MILPHSQPGVTYFGGVSPSLPGFESKKALKQMCINCPGTLLGMFGARLCLQAACLALSCAGAAAGSRNVTPWSDALLGTDVLVTAASV